MSDVMARDLDPTPYVSLGKQMVGFIRAGDERRAEPFDGCVFIPRYGYDQEELHYPHKMVDPPNPSLANR